MPPKILAALLCFLASLAGAHELSFSVPKGVSYQEYSFAYGRASSLTQNLTYDIGLAFSDRKLPLKEFKDSLQGVASLHLGASYWVPVHEALLLGVKGALFVGVLELEQPLYGASGGVFARVRPGRVFLEAGLGWRGFLLPRILRGYYFRDELIWNSFQNTGLLLGVGFDF
jgi:hypothetical protein